jgi:hypothetical protein
MPIPQVLVTRYFQLIASRQLTEAERELERVKQKMQKTDWNRGYFRALYGMYLSRKTNGDAYAFFPKIDLTDKAALHGYRREFLEHMKNRLHDDYDRGYFSAWADCMRVFSRIEAPAASNGNGAASKDGKPATIKGDESQATIESFLDEEKEN